MAIISSVMQIVLLPVTGLAQGTQPIISYNYGANNIDRVKKTFKLCLILCLGYTITMCSTILLIPEVFVRVFNNDPSLMEITSSSMRIYFVGMTMTS
jgi:Na+-driven multidrug efflux pump